jgi:hypothetical protein
MAARLESSVPHFKQALMERLEALPALATGKTVVSWGNPHPRKWPKEVVIIGPATNRTRRFTAGMRQAAEEYDVELVVNITGPAQDTNPANQKRAYELADAVEASLTEWNLEGAPMAAGAWGTVNAIMPGPASDEEGLDDQNRDATVTFEVRITARLLAH